VKGGFAHAVVFPRNTFDCGFRLFLQSITYLVEGEIMAIHCRVAVIPLCKWLAVSFRINRNVAIHIFEDCLRLCSQALSDIAVLLSLSFASVRQTSMVRCNWSYLRAARWRAITDRDFLAFSD
jgi:hypothetical protein